MDNTDNEKCAQGLEPYIGENCPLNKLSSLFLTFASLKWEFEHMADRMVKISEFIEKIIMELKEKETNK